MGLNLEALEGFSFDVGNWLATLEDTAELVEHTTERGVYDLKSIVLLEASVVGLYGCFKRARRRLLEQASAAQREGLEQAEERIRAARSAVRTAAGERREQAERERENSPAELRQLDEKRRAPEERLALIEDASKSA